MYFDLKYLIIDQPLISDECENDGECNNGEYDSDELPLRYVRELPSI